MLLIGLLALALGLCLFRLGDSSLWMDEAYSVELARRPLSTLWLAYSAGGEANMVLYYLILHGWLNLLALLDIPSLEFAVRLPSAIFATASAGVVFQLGRQFSSRLTAAVAAMLFILNAYVLTAAQQTRAYSLQILLVCVSWYALLRALTVMRWTWAWWALYVFATAIACYAQLSTVFIIFTQAVTIAILYFAPTIMRNDVRHRVWWILSSLIAIGLLAAPILIVSRGGSKTGWLAKPGIIDLPGIYAVYTFGKERPPLLIGVALCGLALLFLVWRWYRARSGQERGSLNSVARLPTGDETVFVIALLCWAIFPVLISWIVSQGATRVFSPRYLVIIVPALCLLSGMIVAAIRVASARVILIAGLFIPALIGTFRYYPSAQIEDWRTPARWIEAQYQPGDGLVSFNNNQGAQFAVQYYLHADGSPADFDSASPGLVDWDRLPDPGAFGGFFGALDQKALAAYAARHPRFFYISGRLVGPPDAESVRVTTAWLSSHYHLVSQSTGGAATVWLYSVA